MPRKCNARVKKSPIARNHTFGIAQENKMSMWEIGSYDKVRVVSGELVAGKPC